MTAWMVAHGHTAETILSLPVEIKQDLITLHSKGQIGWRASATQSYFILQFLRSLENVALAVSGNKKGQRKMPDFQELFEGKVKPRKKVGLGNFTEHLDSFLDKEDA